MRAVGIVAEYNPFHAGHALQLQKLRALHPDVPVVIALSGDFVQRGEAAVFSKFARAEAAVRCGASLVLELPLPWSLASAEGFARGGVGLLLSTGVVDALCFGSESGDLARLISCAQALDSPQFPAALRRALANGTPFALARRRAAAALAGEETAAALDAPNDLLATEYIRATRALGGDMAFIPILREESVHDGTGSAAALRRAMASGEDWLLLIPEAAAEVFRAEMEKGRGPVLAEALRPALLSRLRDRSRGDFAKAPDVTEGLHNLLYTAAQEATGPEEIALAAKSKRYALSRLRRAVMCTALGVTSADAAGTPPYLRVLAMDEKGAALLARMRKTASAAVITKPAHIRRESEHARRIFALGSRAHDLYVLGYTNQAEQRGGGDLRAVPCIRMQKSKGNADMRHLIEPTEILLPAVEDLSAWSVVACDQFTSQPEYWEKAAERVGEAPSALRLILPEAWLGTDRAEGAAQCIADTMERYLRSGVFREYHNALVYVERTQPDGRVRRGLVGALDLELYDYAPGSRTPIRATEGTVAERLPPRVAIRRGAALEMPHTIVLMDDRDERVLAPLHEDRELMTKLYDFELMLSGGRLRGWLVEGERLQAVLRALDSLNDAALQREKYGAATENGPLTLAIGDGNHSLAAARNYWEELKATLAPEEREHHPARFSLVELENIHDGALDFEPIHRLLTGTDTAAFDVELSAHRREWEAPGIPLGERVAAAERFCRSYIERFGGSIDYIHGDDTAKTLGMLPGNAAVLLPTVEKDGLFFSVLSLGALPRKSFSMGHASDKRYYLECRRIR